MPKKNLILATVMLAAMASTSPAMAEKGERSWWGSLFGGSAKVEQEGMLSKNFTSDEKAIIRTVFDELFGTGNEREYVDHGKKSKKGGKSMPHGLAKRDHLPPGLQKQIDETGYLPPGLAKRDLPPELVRRLPKRGKGQDVVWIDNDVYLIETATRAVLDVVRDVLK